MDIGINIRHQNGADWNDIRDGVLQAERHGFESVFFPDHFIAIEHVLDADGNRVLADIDSPTGPSDAWTLIAALAPLTTTIRLGTMMTSSTFRPPGLLAVGVHQVNAISGGRVELGLGTNWLEVEHTMFGIPYPARHERFDRLAEQLALITELWSTPSTSTVDIDGRFYQLHETRGLGRPGTTRPRVIVGGSGLHKTPQLIARYADEANSLAREPAGATAFRDACERACESVGRDPSTLRKSVLLSVVIGEDDADIERHLRAGGLTRDQLSDQIVCRPPELIDRLHAWEAAGVDRVVLSRRGSVDLPSLQLIGEQVLPAIRAAHGATS